MIFGGMRFAIFQAVSASQRPFPHRLGFFLRFEIAAIAARDGCYTKVKTCSSVAIDGEDVPIHLVLQRRNQAQVSCVVVAGLVARIAQ